MKPIHHVFNIEYDGLARELKSEAVIQDPISKKRIRLNKVIWDTGATNTCLNVNIAKALGLIPTGQAISHTANGPITVNTYVIDIHLPNNVTINGLNVSDGNLGPNTDILIGMDIIAMGDFTVQNMDGKTNFSFCVPPFEKKYNMVEKANQLNPKIHKDNLKNQKK